MEIIVRQFSGLGNQLFQYAAGLYYSKLYGGTMRMSLDPAGRAVSHGYARPFLLSHFQIQAPAQVLSLSDRIALAQKPSLARFTEPWKRLRGVQVVREEMDQRFTFLQSLPVTEGVRSLYLVGYWQTYRIAEAVSDALRNHLRFKEPPTGQNLEILHQIKSIENAVSLHVRRGDFTLAAEGNIALPLSYYARAINTLRERIPDATFFIFSDDIDYARSNLPLHGRGVFVDHNDALSAHEDLRLMSACQHHILANSSFSWWGAWLNPSPQKLVYAPRDWHPGRQSYYPDVLPPDWILADSF